MRDLCYYLTMGKFEAEKRINKKINLKKPAEKTQVWLYLLENSAIKLKNDSLDIERKNIEKI